jgi:hypothetical protein
MATLEEFWACREIVARLTQRQLGELLGELADTGPANAHADSALRVWLGGEDPNEQGAGALLTQAEAGELLDVERQRLWRWEKQGRIARVATKNSGPLYLRTDVEALKREEDERGARRTRGTAREESQA